MRRLDPRKLHHHAGRHSYRGPDKRGLGIKPVAGPDLFDLAEAGAPPMTSGINRFVIVLQWRTQMF